MILVIGVPSLWACADGAEPAGGTVEVSDSAGITIVEHGPLGDGSLRLARPEPLVEIGVVDGPEEYQLFQVSDAKRLPDGGLAVANGGSRELKIYESDGTHRATAGGPGRGPSEFGYPIAVHALGGDSVMVQDRVDRVFFNARGDFLGRETTDPQLLARLNERVGGNSEGGYWMSDGSFFTPVYRWDQHPPAEGPLFRPEMTFIRTSPDLALVDTLGVYGGIQQQYVDVGEARPSATVPPFSRNTSWGVGSTFGTVVAADNAVPQIEFHGADGRHAIARWTAEPVPVGPDEVEVWKERQRGMAWTRDRLPQLERAWLAMDVPATKPFFGTAASGSDGRVWLGPADEDGQGWLVFGPDGRYRGRVALPAAFRPMDSGPGWVLGLYRGEADVEFVRLYGLVEE